MRTGRGRAGVVAMVLVGLVAGCGGDGGTATGDTTAPGGGSSAPAGDGAEAGTASVSARIGDSILRVELPDGWVGGTCGEILLGHVDGLGEELCEGDGFFAAGVPDSQGACEEDGAEITTTPFPGSYDLDEDKVPEFAEEFEGDVVGGDSRWLLHRYYLDERTGCAGGEVQVLVPDYGRVDVSMGGPPDLLDEETFLRTMGSITVRPAP